MYMDNHRVR